MKRILLLAFVLGSLAAAFSSFAAGLIIVDETHWIYPPPWPGPPPHPIPPPRPPPFPMPPPRPFVFAPLELVSHKVNARISDQLATTTVEQEFFNPNDRRMEGTFLFPAPKGAQIKKFT